MHCTGEIEAVVLVGVAGVGADQGVVVGERDPVGPGLLSGVNGIEQAEELAARHGFLEDIELRPVGGAAEGGEAAGAFLRDFGSGRGRAIGAEKEGEEESCEDDEGDGEEVEGFSGLPGRGVHA